MYILTDEAIMQRNALLLLHRLLPIGLAWLSDALYTVTFTLML